MLGSPLHRMVALFQAALLAILFGISPVLGQSTNPEATASSRDTPRARQIYEQGVRAEHAAQWEEAFEAYSAAASESPGNRNFQLRREFARSELVRQLSGDAERQLVSGRNEQARAILEKVLALAPSYSVARERLAQITELQTVPPALPPVEGPRMASGPPRIQAQPGTRNFDIRGTTRTAYEDVARQFGVVVAFDTDMNDRNIRFVAPGVDFETALRLLGEQTGTFWSSADGRTIFVAADTADKRRTYEPEVEETILLPASENNDEMTETSRVVRDIVGLRRSQLNLAAHTLTVRDTLANVALAKSLVEEVEQGRGEALLEIDILEVDKQLARQMGVTPPTSATAFTLSSAQVQQLQNTPTLATVQQILQTIFGAQNPLLGAAGALVPPLIAFGSGKLIFLSTLPGASVTMSQALSVVKSAQRVLLRLEDGRPATLFVGQHYPITLALLSESFVGQPTQFTPGVLPGAFPRTDSAVGHNPSGIVIGDFNGDGKPDLAVTNESDDTVSILLGNGDGTFGTATTFPAGKGPVALISGDFNRDGLLDLAVVDNCDVTVVTDGPCAASDYAVSILPGKGDGTFGPPTSFTVGTSPVALLSNDFNQDGKLDLAVVNQGANTVSILLGNGDGTFAAKQDFAVGTTPTGIALGDFNSDGKPDLAVTNRGANSFSVLLSRGDGTFTTQSNFTTGTGPSAIATADFNGDGRVDVAVTNSTDNTVSIILGNGDGTFSTGNTYPTGAAPSAVIAGDSNLDGIPDVLVTNRMDNTVSVFLGLGDGTLVNALTLATGTAPVALALADLNNDGIPDLAVVDQTANTVSSFLNTSIIPVSSNASQTAYPGSEYVDLGLKVRANPRIHPNNEVTLDLQFDISSLSGQNVNGIPILSNRVIQQTLRLRENQTSLLSGILQSNEARTISGLPWLAEVPGPVGYLTGLHGKQKSDTELLIVITPRQMRLAPRVDRSLYAGRGAGNAPAAGPAGPTAIPGVAPGLGAPPPAAPALVAPTAPAGAGTPPAATPGAAPPLVPAPSAPPAGAPPSAPPSGEPQPASATPPPTPAPPQGTPPAPPANQPPG